MTLRGLTFLGIPNLISSPVCTVETGGLAGLEPTGLESFWLKTEEPADISRLLSLDPLYSRWFFHFGYVSVTLDGFAAINVNFSPGSKYRFVGNFGTTEPGPKTKAPNAFVGTPTNVTGVVGNVDEPISTPDSSYIGPTVTNADWDAHFSFDTLAQPPVTGYAMCQIVARVRLFVSGAGDVAPLTYPSFGVDIYESGAFVESIGVKAVTVSDADGQVLIFPFDPAILANPNGLNLEVRVFSEPGESVSGHQYCQLESLHLYYETAGDVDLDSGWLDTPDISDTVDAPTLDVSHFPQDSWNDVRLLSFLVLDDQTNERQLGNKVAGPSGVPVGLVDANPDQFVEAGVVCAGAAVFLSHGIRKNSPASARPLTEEVAGSTGGGQTHAADAYRFREGETLEPVVTRDEGLNLQDRLGWRRGHSGAFYIAMEPDIDPRYQVFSSIWATLLEMGSLEPLPDSIYRSNGQMLYTLALRVREKL